MKHKVYRQVLKEHYAIRLDALLPHGSLTGATLLVYQQQQINLGPNF